MSKQPSRSSRSSITSKDAGDLLFHLRRIASSAPDDRPLPTTRDLGQRFGVANTTVFRALSRLIESGEIWQHPVNGRYYPVSARAQLDRPKPVACLIRRLELGSELYRELLEGISAGCGQRHRTMLLWHDELLVNHPLPRQPPNFAPVTQQRAILHDFLARHRDAAGGYILDHVWSDEALREHADRLQPAVVLFRRCDIPTLSNIRADFHEGALKALEHLIGRGFDLITPVEPFRGDPAVAEFTTALAIAADELNCGRILTPVARAHTERDRSALIQRLQRSRGRTALLCPEDNVAALLVYGVRAAGLRCPEQVGVLSVMGTDFALRAGTSCIRYDYRELGRLAVAAVSAGEVNRQVLAPTFGGGATT